VAPSGLTIKGSLAGYVHSLSRNRSEYGIALDYEGRALVRNKGGPLEVKKMLRQLKFLFQ
jgi:hypothetical protein